MGFLSGLMGGTTSTATSSTGMPAWFEAYSQNLASAGTNRFLNAPYPGAFTGERVAGDNPDIEASRAAVRGMQGESDPMIDQAAGTAASIGTHLDRPALDSFMNPYTDSVVDRLGVLGQRNLENSLRGVNANFISGGNFGSGEHGEFTARAVRDSDESTLAEQNKALNTGYGQSLGAYGDAQTRALQASGQMGALAKLKQDTSLRDAAALEEVGKDQRQRTQMGNDVRYSDYLEGRDWDRNMVQGAAGVGAGINAPTTTTNTQTSRQDAGLGQLLGLGTSIAGLFMAEGGEVPDHKEPDAMEPSWDPATGLYLLPNELYIDPETGMMVDPEGHRYRRPERRPFATNKRRGGALRRAA